MAGDMDKAAYLKRREELTAQIGQLEEQIAALEAKAEEVRAADSSEVSNVLESVHHYEKADALTSEMIKTFIKQSTLPTMNTLRLSGISIMCLSSSLVTHKAILN